MRIVKGTPTVLQVQAKVGTISQAAFREAFGRGQHCHIWSKKKGKKTQFKGCSLWIGPQWMCVQQHWHSDAHAEDSKSLLIGLYHKMQNPHPSLHIICCGLISHVFTWIGLVTDNLFIWPSRDSSPSLYVFILLINMEDNTVWDPMTNFYWLAWTLGQSLFGKAVCGVPCRNISALCNCVWVQSIYDKEVESIGNCWCSTCNVYICVFAPSCCYFFLSDSHFLLFEIIN